MIVYRVTERMLDVEGILCKKNSEGIYVPKNKKFRNCLIIDMIISAFLDEERKALKQKLNKKVDDLLTKKKINYELN